MGIQLTTAVGPPGARCAVYRPPSQTHGFLLFDTRPLPVLFDFLELHPGKVPGSANEPDPMRWLP